MKKIDKVYCFFEQSGTFKNIFLNKNIKAFDYDILNDFNQTDYIIDLFNEINNCYENKKSIFDDISSDDLIIAFFPCVRFENQVLLNFRGENSSFKKWSVKKKLEYDLKLHNELNEMYLLITKLVIICIDRNIPLIIENPYSSQHYLQKYWCLKPTIVDMNRWEHGDYYKKPTQYWFINILPENNIIFTNNYKDKLKVSYQNKVTRSLISADYAKWFIESYILESEKL